MSNCVRYNTDKDGCLVYEMNQGSAHTITIYAEAEVAPNSYVPVDLSGQDEIRIDFKKVLSQSGRVIFSKDLTDGITVSGNDNNIINITINQEDTEGCCMNLIGTLSIKKGDYREDLMNIKLDIYPITNNNL